MTRKAADPVVGRALVADDHPTNRLVMCGLMRRLGYSVDEACDGAEAAMMGGSGSYDVVLMDLNMPVLDGFEATRLLRDQERAMQRRPARVVAVSAWVDTESRQRAFDAGVDYFVPKPVKIGPLEEALGAPRVVTAMETPTSDTGLHLAHLEEVGGMELVRQALELFIGHGGTIMDQLTTMDSSLTDEVRSLAHTLKGSSLAIGATSLAGLAERLETRAASGDATAWRDLGPKVLRAMEEVRDAAAPYLAT